MRNSPNMRVHGFLQPTPLFPIYVVAGDHGIEAVNIGGPEPDCPRDDRNPVIAEAVRQLEGYFRGDLRTFDLPLAAAGTPYQQRVWEALRQIPFGETISYAELAARVGSVARAAGQANGANPIAIIIPCHRVINADGGLGGYAGGLERKQYLLELERAIASGIKLVR